MSAREELERTWCAVDELVCTSAHAKDVVLDEVLRACDAAGLPKIQVSECQGKFLYLLTLLRGASRVLEFGTLGGYSTIWMARGLRAGGHIVTLELDPRHAEIARANFARAGVSDRVSVRVGAALDLLPGIAAESPAPFDLIFIDADKQNSARYLEWSLKLCARGAVIIIDNIVRRGSVLDEGADDANIRGCREAMQLLGSSPNLDATVLQTVGSKGYDGFAIALVR